VAIAIAADDLKGVDYFRLHWDKIATLRSNQLPPDIITFTTSPDYLNRPNLYPRQATLLKLVTLQTELLTPYDYQVIEQWTKGFWLPERSDQVITHYEGDWGLQPDILERIALLRVCPCGHDRSTHTGGCQSLESGVPDKIDGFCEDKGCDCDRYAGNRWFNQALFVGGRRGSKGHLGAIVGAYVLWNYLCLADPQDHYGVDRDKKLSCQVFAGKKEQARDNQWRDLVNVVRGAPCFQPFENKSLTDYLSLYSRSDIASMLDGAAVSSTMDMATFTIEPKEATIMASRGPASFMQYYDEFAHIVRGVARVDGSELEDSAKPALDQFKRDAFMWQGSSPWTMQGRFYENWLNALEVEPDTDEPVYPEVFMVHLTSWDPYEDWERAHTIPMRPRHRREFRPPCFKRLRSAVQEYDAKLQREERANPDTFRVERRAKWATALDAYLSENFVARLWEPWRGQTLHMQEQGKLAFSYRAHGDPSKSGANFGFAMAHREGPDENGYYHVVFDLITHWEPGDFEQEGPDGTPIFEIDYDTIARYMEERIIRPFAPYELTFDQFNAVATIQRLQKYANQAQLPKRVSVYERTATAPLNWKTYETFKTALGMDLVHAPFYEKANQELLFLQKETGNKVDHPTSGPVQTKDVADCIAIVTYELIGEQMTAFIAEALGDLSLGGTGQGGLPQAPQRAAAAAANPAGGVEQAHRDLSAFTRTTGRGGMNPGAPRSGRRRGGYPRRR
jgi:hypothetical protein